MIWMLGSTWSLSRRTSKRGCVQSSPLYRGAWVLGETKTSRGHIGTDGFNRMQFCSGHCRANSFLEQVCPSLYLQLNTLEVFTPHLSFPKRPSPIFSSYFVVVNHSLSVYIFYVGHDFVQRGSLARLPQGEQEMDVLVNVKKPGEFFWHPGCGEK